MVLTAARRAGDLEGRNLQLPIHGHGRLCSDGYPDLLRRRRVMRLTQGTFSFLPELSDEQVEKQIQYCLNNGWSLGIEYTDDPHPRNSLREMWGLPMFDVIDPRAIMHALDACRKVFPNHYIKIIANNST